MLVALSACLTLAAGCASSAVIAAAGVTAGFGLAQGQAESFISGKLKAARLVTLDNAAHATLATMDELQLKVLEERHGTYDAYFVGQAEGGPEFKVTLKAKTPVVTKIEIRIGLMGDQAVSRLVLSRLDRKLGIEQPIIPVEQSPIVAPPMLSKPASQPADATQPSRQ